MKPNFKPGHNIAMKVPTHEYTATVKFYRDILGLTPIEQTEKSSTESTCFAFGDKVLWIDCVCGISQAEIWLEVQTDDPDKASKLLSDHGCTRRDEIEPLPDGLNGFWISSPCNIIHLVTSSRPESES